METTIREKKPGLPADCGALDHWEVDELPAPPP
jgi:hypothetical protein